MIVNATQTTGFEIFEPLMTAKPGSRIIITTWNLGNTITMEPVISAINACDPQEVNVLVGYSKDTHNLDSLLGTMRYYERLGWKIRALPSYHGKVWVVNDKAWVGSCNFVRSTIINHMWEVPKRKVEEFLLTNIKQSATLSRTTDLSLIPQAKLRVL